MNGNNCFRFHSMENSTVFNYLCYVFEQSKNLFWKFTIGKHKVWENYNQFVLIKYTEIRLCQRDNSWFKGSTDGHNIIIYICKVSTNNTERDPHTVKFLASVQFILSLDHITFWVGNAKQAASFYTSRFGF